MRLAATLQKWTKPGGRGFLALPAALLFVAAGLLPTALRAQTITSVSAQVLDQQGMPWAGAQVVATLVPPAGGASPTVTTTGAAIITPVYATADFTGTWNMQLIANGSITPASTTYTFRMCEPFVQPPIGASTQSCFTVTGITISGSSQSLTQTMNGSAVQLLQQWAPMRLFKQIPAAGNTSISATTMVASAPTSPTAGARYALSFYVSQTVAGTSCSGNSTIAVNAIFQDANAASAQTVAVGTFTVTTNGTLGEVPLTSGTARIAFVAKGGTAVQYSTTYTAGSACSPAPMVQVYPVLDYE